jgi:hypothetical protein
MFGENVSKTNKTTMTTKELAGEEAVAVVNSVE